MQPHVAERINDAKRETTYYYHGIADVVGDEGLWEFGDRYADFADHVELRPNDTVLDVGCAEGLISMAVAGRVQHVDAYELSLERVEAARKIATERGLSNITFAQADAAALSVAPMSYDVVLFLGVYHHMQRGDKVRTLNRLMHAARRLFIMRTPLNHQTSPTRLSNIYSIVERHNFTVTIHPNRDNLGGNLMVMWRDQGVGSRA